MGQVLDHCVSSKPTYALGTMVKGMMAMLVTLRIFVFKFLKKDDYVFEKKKNYHVKLSCLTKEK
jgi:hypothetical protein